MNPVYIETSALLDWLLGRPNEGKMVDLLNEAETVTSSVVTLLEAERTFIRGVAAGTFTSTQRNTLRGKLQRAMVGWIILDLNREVRERCTEPYPVEPVRTLDALHLACALELVKIFQNIRIVSCDQRILDNAVPLGLQVLNPRE